jgi:deoxyribose-phosphate aldolase
LIHLDALNRIGGYQFFLFTADGLRFSLAESLFELKSILILQTKVSQTDLTLQVKSRNAEAMANVKSPEDPRENDALALIAQLKSTADELRMRLALPAISQARQNLPHPVVVTTRAAQNLAARIDHTLLKAEATRADVQRACTEAREHGFATVCVNSSWIPFVAEQLKGSASLPIAVVGFPLGAMSSSAKAFETRKAISDGAREIDMVIPIGALKGREYETVMRDIAEVIEAAHPSPVKVIIETSLLTFEEKIAAICLSQAAGAAFVKTSTGFAGGGATVEDVKLMRAIVGQELGVKASGGIRTREDAERMIAAGADRVGASASVAIVTTGGSAGGGGY